MQNRRSRNLRQSLKVPLRKVVQKPVSRATQLSTLMAGAAVLAMLASCKGDDAQNQQVTITGENVNCRSGPSVTDPVVEVLAFNSQWPVIESTNDWTKLRGDSNPCWVSADFSTVTSPLPTLPINEPVNTNQTFVLTETVDPMSDAVLVSAVAQMDTSAGVAEMKISCTNGERFSSTFSSYQRADSAGNMGPLEFETVLNPNTFTEMWGLEFRIDDYESSRAQCVAGATCRYSNRVPIDLVTYIRNQVSPAVNGNANTNRASQIAEYNARKESIKSEYSDLGSVGAMGYYTEYDSSTSPAGANQRIREANSRLREVNEMISRANQSASSQNDNTSAAAFSAWSFMKLTIRYTAGGFRETVSFPISDNAVRRVVASCAA